MSSGVLLPLNATIAWRRRVIIAPTQRRRLPTPYQADARLSRFPFRIQLGTCASCRRSHRGPLILFALASDLQRIADPASRRLASSRYFARTLNAPGLLATGSTFDAMLESRRFPETFAGDPRALPSVSAPAPVPPLAAPTARRSRAFVFGLLVYVALLVAAFATGNTLLDELAAFALFSVLLLPGLRRGHVPAWFTWLALAAVLAWLAHRGQGQLALDSLPVLINAALCMVFARTLRAGCEPLIARIIRVLEGPERLAQPGVERYARRLTWAWAFMLGLQACVLLVIVVCSVPDGALASFGARPPLAIASTWRWYLHLGSYASVPGFLVLEYAYRRWRLRHLPHAPLPVFLARLARRWPALAASFANDTAHTDP